MATGCGGLEPNRKQWDPTPSAPSDFFFFLGCSCACLALCPSFCVALTGKRLIPLLGQCLVLEKCVLSFFFFFFVRVAIRFGRDFLGFVCIRMSAKMPALDKKHVVVCGAGLVGCLCALILAKRGYDGEYSNLYCASFHVFSLALLSLAVEIWVTSSSMTHHIDLNLARW